MEKIKDLLPEIAFVAVLIRISILGAGIGEALSLFALVALISFRAYLSKTHEDKYSQLELKIEQLAVQIQTVNLNNSVRRQESEKVPSFTGPAKRMF